MFDVEYELNTLMKKALDLQVSDIHIEPSRQVVLVKFRIDGLLEEICQIDKIYQDKLANRIKIVSHIDIGEKRIPQDGRWSFTHKERVSTFRVSTMPTIWGEKFVIRVQGNKDDFMTLSDLGMSTFLEQSLRKILHRPHGLFLVTGPTGSGKSTTLYAILNELNQGRENIICLENPVEYEIKGTTQVEINEKSGLTFAAGLRAGLRQDPDIIMVGEIRDAETAQLAIQSALTGHKVLSTIHTNDAAGVIERLIDIGVEPFLVKAALSGALAQRLVRKPCPFCEGHDETCTHCRGTGYKGRTAIYELLAIPEEGMCWEKPEDYVKPTLRESAKLAVQFGLTTYEELMRVGLEELA